MKTTLGLSAIFLTALWVPAAPSFNEAMDTTDFQWGLGGNAPWAGQTAVTHDGVDAVRGWSPGDGLSSWLYTTVTGPGTVAFWWKASTEVDCDFLEFSIGGVLQSRTSGEQDWQQVTFAVPAGSQELRWTFRKDAYGAWGQDAVWLDELAFVPDSGPPVILAQPVSRTAAVGDSVTLLVGAAGSQPRRYQWYLNQTNAIAGATSSSLTFPSVQLTNAGSYTVVVTNGSGSVTSAPAVLAMTTNHILFFADSPYGSPFYLVLNSSGRPYQRFTSESDFNAALSSANPANTLAVVDSIWDYITSSALVSFVNAGGRAILQYWNFSAESSLAAAFKVTVAQTISTPLPVYDWGGTPLFSGLSSPFNLVETLWLSDGQKLQPASGGQAVAGYAGTPTANQAALVVGNAGRTILNGFLVEDFSVLSDAMRFGQNEINYLMPLPPSILIGPLSQTANSGSSVTLTVTADGTAPLAYQWFFSATNLLAGATNSALTLTNVQGSQSGLYLVVVSNAAGLVTSQPANLTVRLAIGDALNAPALAWVLSGSAYWFTQTNITHDGSAAVQSGPITHSQNSRVQALVTGPGMLTFWWKVSSESGGDTLGFYLSTVLVTNISGETDWQPQTVYVGAGSWFLRWSYIKNAGGSSGQDCGWVDQVTYTPGNTPAFVTTPPQSQTVVAGTNVLLMAGAAGTPPLSYQWSKDGTNLAGATNVTLLLTNVCRRSGGLYTVTATNDYGGMPSSPATLRVCVPQQLRPELLADGSFRLSSGDADGGPLLPCDVAGFEVQASTNLVTPVSWVTLPNALTLTNGLLRLHDPQSPAHPARFYKVVER
jgi:hypothetical protein